MSTPPAQGGILPGVPGLQRPVLISAAVGVAAVGIGIYFHHWLFGLLLCFGLSLGLLNTAMTQAAVARVTAQANPNKSQLAVSSLSRLLLITAVALMIGFLLRPDGVGIFVGLAIFQVILVINTTVPVMRGLRQHD